MRREQQPTFISPMLLTSGALPGGEAWSLEIKWDGCRGQLRYDGHSVSLRTRNGRECSADFPGLSAIAGSLGPRRVTVDGELVCLRDDGRRESRDCAAVLPGSGRNPHPVTFHAFDGLSRDSAISALLHRGFSGCKGHSKY